MQQETSRQVCHPRIKRILKSFQESAEHSLSGPPCPNSAVDVPAPRRTIVDQCTKTAAGRSSVSTTTKHCENVPADESKTASRRTGGSVSIGSVISILQPSRLPRAPDTNRPLLMAADGGASSCELVDTLLEGETIKCFEIGGERRLCLPQVINKVLFNILDIKTEQCVYKVSDELHVFFAECTAPQLEVLKHNGVLPSGTSRSGLVTQTDAERMCAMLMSEALNHRPSPEGDYIPVVHECFGGCRGKMWPSEYDSMTSWCIECEECGGCLSPMEFVAHSHGGQEDRTCHWGFNSLNWRSYLMLSDDVIRADDQQHLQNLLDEIKLKFIGQEQVGRAQHKDEIVAAKRARVQVKKEPASAAATGARRVPTPNDKWHPVDVYSTWAACLNVVKTLADLPNQSRVEQLPQYLYTGTPVLDNPDRVVPFDDQYRYDRGFAPNVTLSAAPFDELRKLCESESDDVTVADGADQSPTSSWRRRSTHSLCETGHPETVDDDDDTDSVSSDKLELCDDERCEDDEDVDADNVETKLKSALLRKSELIRSAIGDIHRDEVAKQSLIDRFLSAQGRQVKVVKSLEWSQNATIQDLRDVWALDEKRKGEDMDAQQLYEEKLVALRADAAAKMREVALERHALLRQIESLSSASNMSDQAVMAAQYKEEAEHWKRRLIEVEADNGRLRQEVAALRKALQHQENN